MAEEQSKDDRPLVERWLEDQQEWQKTMLRYMDSMANNEEFLQHLGNAMRGSLLAGKPYPGTEPPRREADDDDASARAGSAATAGSPAGAASDDRLDRILFTLHEIQGQLNDLHLTVDRLTATIERTRAAGNDVGNDNGSDNDNDADATPAELNSPSVEAAAQDPSARSRFSRNTGPASAQPKMRRSQPRSAFGRRGDAD